MTPKIAPTEETEAPEEPKAYTIRDSFASNARLIAEIADQENIDPQVAATIFATTLSAHFTRLQLGLAQPAQEDNG